MRQILTVPVAVLVSVVLKVENPALAEHQDVTAVKDWRWESIASLFPHTPGMRWVYTLSGAQYINGGELSVEIKGRQHHPQLQQEVLLVEETHPGAAVDASAEVAPVLYYPREGYLVRDTSYIYSNPQRTSLLSTGNLGEAVAPVLPLWRQVDGTDWSSVDAEHWGKASKLDVAYRVHPEKREIVTVKAGQYEDCVLVEGTVRRSEEDGYRYQEWYAPGVGLVQSTTSDLRSGKVLAHKELVSFQSTKAPDNKS
jgi:hypothetical protein